MDYTTIRSINSKYIFVKIDGKEDRTTTKKSDLIEVLEELNNDSDFYNRMILETQKTYNKASTELEKLETYRTHLESIIEENKEDPMYKRGIADACFSLEYTNKQIHNTLCNMSGINTVIHDAMMKREHTDKLIKQCIDALKVIR